MAFCTKDGVHATENSNYRFVGMAVGLSLLLAVDYETVKTEN